MVSILLIFYFRVLWASGKKNKLHKSINNKYEVIRFKSPKQNHGCPKQKLMSNQQANSPTIRHTNILLQWFQWELTYLPKECKYVFCNIILFYCLKLLSLHKQHAHALYQATAKLSITKWFSDFRKKGN